MEYIFLENRTIAFADPGEKAPAKAITYGYRNMEDLIDFVMEEVPETLPARTTVWIECHNAQETFQLFISQFKVVEAAGGLVKAFDSNKNSWTYLYIYRYGMWDLPKGKKEKGETDEENALREVMEETGVKNIRICRFLRSTYHFIGIKGGDKVAIKKSNWFEMESEKVQDVRPQVEEGIVKAEWLSPEEISDRKNLMYSSIALLTQSYFN